GVYQIQVVPIRVDAVVVSGPRQADVGEGRIGRRELGVAVGRQINAREALIVQRVREWQGNGGHRVISVIADVGCTRHDTAANLTYGVLVAGRTRRRGCR